MDGTYYGQMLRTLEDENSSISTHPTEEKYQEEEPSGNSPSSTPSAVTTTKRYKLDLILIGITISAWLVLESPWSDLRAMVTPLFLFLLPGSGIVVVVFRTLNGLATLVASSFVTSVGFVFILRTMLLRLYPSPTSYFLIDTVGIFTLSLLLIGLSLDATRESPPSFSFEKWDLFVTLLLVTLYLDMSLFVLFSANYTPLPDELKYLLDARNFNLAGLIPILDPTKTWVANFITARPLWFVSLGSYLLASRDVTFSSQVLGVFFFSMLVLGTYRIGRKVLDGKVGLISAILMAVSPTLLIWGSTVLLDVPFAVLITLGYGFFLDAVQLRNGKLGGFGFGALILAIACFAMAILTKVADPTFIVLLYFYFVYLVWKSAIPSKRLILSVLVVLPAIYLTFDGLYNIFTYVIPDASIHNLIRPFLPVSFFERFFAFYHSGTTYKPITAVTPLGVLQGMYLAAFEPSLFTYPILFMSIAGGLVLIRNKSDITKKHAIFSLFIIASVSFLAGLLLFFYDIPRNVLYIYPFIVVAAACGFRFFMRRDLKYFLVLSAGLVVVIYLIESSMLSTGIDLGPLTASYVQNLSLFTINFAVGGVILGWKILDSLLGRAFHSLSKITTWLGGGRILAITLVTLLCLSQFIIFTQLTPYRSSSDFQGLNTWLDSNVHPGDTIFTNGQGYLMSLANQSTLQLIEDGGIHLLSVPNNLTSIQQLALTSSPNVYLVMFTLAEYTMNDSYSPGQYILQDGQLSTDLVNGSIFQVYSLSPSTLSTISILQVSTVNSSGELISGFYLSLSQAGSVIDSCFSPCYFAVTNGQTYQVASSSYVNETFNHWANDGSTGFETVNVPATSTTLQLEAVYSP